MLVLLWNAMLAKHGLLSINLLEFFLLLQSSSIGARDPLAFVVVLDVPRLVKLQVLPQKLQLKKAVQTNKSSPLTLEAAVQVDIHLTPAPPQPQAPTASAVQAGPAAGQHRAEQAHFYPRTVHNFCVPDTLCPDTVYQSPAAQVVPPHHHVTHQNVPQLDGQDDVEEGPHSKHQCDTCQAAFESEQQLHQHSESHGYGCDECFICYTSKYLVDLHELQEHPETSYARDHIPESTKIEFEARNRTR